MIKRLLLLAALGITGGAVRATSSGGHAAVKPAANAGSSGGAASAQDNAHAGAEQFRNREEEMRISMINISRQLSVTCTTCHNPKNFASNEKGTFKTAKEHMRLTQLLIDQGFDGLEKRPKADCYMCHRGKLKPDFKEPIDPLIQDKAKTKAH